MSDKNLKAVLFDLDDTLYDDTTAMRLVIRQLAEGFRDSHALDEQLLREAFYTAADAYWDHVQRASPEPLSMGSRRWVWMHVLRSAGMEVESEHAREFRVLFERSCKQYLRPFPGAVELLRTLRERGLKLGLVTNGLSETHRDKIAWLEIEPLFDGLFIADEVGFAKPDPRFFTHACERLGVSPGRSAMVGDRLDRDVWGAQEAGLLGIWFNVRRDALPSGTKSPDGIARNFVELLGLLAP